MSVLLFTIVYICAAALVFIAGGYWGRRRMRHRIRRELGDMLAAAELMNDPDRIRELIAAVEQIDRGELDLFDMLLSTVCALIAAVVVYATTRAGLL